MRPTGTKNPSGCLNGQKRWDRGVHQHTQGDLATLDEVGTGKEPRLPRGFPACRGQVEEGGEGKWAKRARDARREGESASSMLLRGQVT